MYFIERYRLGKMLAFYGPYEDRIDAEEVWARARKFYDQDHIVLTSDVAEFYDSIPYKEDRDG